MNFFDVPCQKKQIYMLKIDISHIDHSQWTHCVIKRQKFERLWKESKITGFEVLMNHADLSPNSCFNNSFIEIPFMYAIFHGLLVNFSSNFISFQFLNKVYDARQHTIKSCYFDRI